MSIANIPLSWTTWNSKLSGSYHDNHKCHVGNNIEQENIQQGRHGKDICEICRDLKK